MTIKDLDWICRKERVEKTNVPLLTFIASDLPESVFHHGLHDRKKAANHTQRHRKTHNCILIKNATKSVILACSCFFIISSLANYALILHVPLKQKKGQPDWLICEFSISIWFNKSDTSAHTIFWYNLVQTWALQIFNYLSRYEANQQDFINPEVFEKNCN